MSVVTVEQVKSFLAQFHGADDVLIQMLVDGAEDEAKRYLGLDELPRQDSDCPDCSSDSTANPASDTSDVAPTVRNGIFLLVQAIYAGTDADEAARYRELALDMMRPYRCGWGV